jgi:hypothetical protein
MQSREHRQKVAKKQRAESRSRHLRAKSATVSLTVEEGGTIMKFFKVVGLAILSLILTSQSVAQRQNLPQKPPQFDAVKDWSAQSNPNGTWSYGYVTSWGATFTLYEVSGSNWPGISFWVRQLGVPPDVGHNDTKKQICGETWCIPPKYLHFHPGPDGEISVLRWTAPDSATYTFRVRSEGLDWLAPSTIFYIVQNSQEVLLQAPVNSYKQAAKWNPKPIRLTQGETIDFMVAVGDHYYCDSTGVAVKIWEHRE